MADIWLTLFFLGNIMYYKLLNAKEKIILTSYRNRLVDVTTVFQDANIQIYFHLKETQIRHICSIFFGNHSTWNHIP